MLHFDTKRLPLLKGEKKDKPRDYLFVGIDDFYRELYAGIYPDKTQDCSAAFLRQVLEECPYTIECAYSDNGTEYKGTSSDQSFVALCKAQGMGQEFTRVKRPQTNKKGERVIKTLMRCGIKNIFSIQNKIDKLPLQGSSTFITLSNHIPYQLYDAL